MPTYAYRCTACSHEFEIFQKFTDQPLTACPECGSAIRKVFQPVGIVFKGSGWYINDSRAPEKDPAKASVTPGKNDAAPAGDAGASETAAKPAPAPAEPGAKPAPAVAKAAAD